MTKEALVQLEADSRVGLFNPGRLVFRDAWFALAHRSAVGDKPIQRMLHETPIVIWRDGQGVVRAMEDRCAHRRAPMSRGKLVEGNLQCPYHGWIYDGAGQVVKVPAMGDDYAVPRECRVPSYPVVVRYGHVWVWQGDEAAADPALIPDVPFIDPDGEAPSRGTNFYDVPQELLIENILDLTHIDYIHAGLLGNNSQGGEEEIGLESTDETVTTLRTTKGRPPPAAMAALFGFPKTQDIYNVTRVYVRSGCAIATISYTPPGWGLLLFITNTPEGPNRIRQDYSQVVIGPWIWRTLMAASTGLIRDQDHWVMKLQDLQYQKDDDRLDMSSPVDAPGMRYRQIRRKLAQRQDEGDFAYTDGWSGTDAADVLKVPNRLRHRP